MQKKISVWEGEGGFISDSADDTMTGTVNQIEWALEIKARANAEFDRVATALRTAADRQSTEDRRDTHAMLVILEDKRAQVMARRQAGYFIHDWQELRDQVRQMIMQDARYKSIKAR